MNKSDETFKKFGVTEFPPNYKAENYQRDLHLDSVDLNREVDAVLEEARQFPAWDESTIRAIEALEKVAI